MSVNVDVGPIDYLALEFPGARLTGEGMAILVDLVDRGIIRVLDMKALVRARLTGPSPRSPSPTSTVTARSTWRSSRVSSPTCSTRTTSRRPPRWSSPGTPWPCWSTRTRGPGPSSRPCAGRVPRSWRACRIPADAVIARLEALEAAEASAGPPRSPSSPIRANATQNVNTYERRSTRWDSSVEWPGRPSSPGRPRRCRTGCRAVRPGAGQRRRQQQQPSSRSRAPPPAVRRPATTSSGHRGRPRPAQAARGAAGLRRLDGGGVPGAEGAHPRPAD